MSVFFILLLVGLVGLALLGLPGLLRAGSHAGHVGHGGHVGHVGAHAGHGTHHGTHPVPVGNKSGTSESSALPHWIPEPRVLCTLTALTGAFGNLAHHLLQSGTLPALAVGLVPALLVERVALRPLWNWGLRFQGRPSAPLEALVMERAQAVTPFRNGRGMVCVDRDGRRVQFAANLVPEHQGAQVRVGDPLRIEAVHGEKQFLLVSVL